jgi:hypothetical protein
LTPVENDRSDQDLGALFVLVGMREHRTAAPV